MVTYIYFVKCPNCEDEHFDFFDDAKGFAMGCLSKKPIITQTEVCRNDFGECTDSADLGTVWSWEDVMKDTEEPEANVFTKDDLKAYEAENDPEFADDDFFAVNDVKEEWDPDDYDSPEEAADAYDDLVDAAWDSRYDKGLDELDRPLPEYRYVYDETTGKYKHILVNKDAFTQDELRRLGELDEAITAGISFRNSEDLAEFKKLCDEIGIKTMGDIKTFMRDNNANDANIIDKLKEYRKELGPDFKIKEAYTDPETECIYNDNIECTNNEDCTDCPNNPKAVLRKPVPEGMTIEQLVETMEENEDEVECTWCNDLFPKDMCKKEVNLGYLCPRCADGIMSRGETLTFKQNNYWDFLDGDKYFNEDFADPDADRAFNGHETVELIYDYLTVTVYGPQRDADDWDEWEQSGEYWYKVTKNEVAEVLWNECLTEEDVKDVPGGLETLEDDDEYDNFLAVHFDDLLEKYYDKILDYFRDDAKDAASEDEDFLDI